MCFRGSSAGERRAGGVLIISALRMDDNVGATRRQSSRPPDDASVCRALSLSAKRDPTRQERRSKGQV